MTEEPIKEDPVEKFRKLIASFIPLARPPKKESEMQSDKDAPSSPPQKNTGRSDALNALPKKKDAAKAPSVPTPAVTPLSAPKPAPAAGTGPTPKFDSAPKGAFSIGGPRLWTAASVISLTVNIVMTVILIVLVVSVYRLKLDMAKIMNAATSVMELPGGLYSNFEKMERASIETNVVVDTSIPVKFDLSINQQTNVVLSQDVTIANAKVTVNTGGLNITQANTTITLPAGTVLPINLSLTVPVNQQVPVTLNVPVDIALKDTDLNEPFVGLQGVIQPLYCLLDPLAVDMDKQPICP